MNPFDVVLVVLAGALLVVGLYKGLVRILVGIAAFLLALSLAALFHVELARRFTDGEPPGAVAGLVAYVCIFLAVMLAGGLVALLLRRLMKAAMLGWADRLGGAALGLLAAVLFAALILMPLVAYLPGTGDVLGGSLLAPYVIAVADGIENLMPADFTERYREGVERIKRRWRGQPEVDGEWIEARLRDRAPGTRCADRAGCAIRSRGS